MKKAVLLIPFLIVFSMNSCSGENTEEVPQPKPAAEQPPQSVTYKYLALGDSYTIGQSVCETCRFPEQLKTRLQSAIPGASVNLSLIAQTGWTTTNLKNAIAAQDPASDFDLVTLLIGVNNQYQNKPFALYESEFPELLSKAISLARGDRNNVIVVSIPDYRYTPYGDGLLHPEPVSEQIDQYNAFAQNYCLTQHVNFINITDITRLGLENPELVTTDGLHPSAAAYAQFVTRILPQARIALQN